MKDEKNLLAECVGLLLPWYREHRRSMPWRDDPAPYHVWLSEIMLQQTRIEAAAPYYERFLRALPAVEDLAACGDERLMKLWQGLGYYSRARNLKKAAGMVVERFGGAIPDEAAELRKLPGVGSYTAGAIASIAFGKPEPAVDGNVLRVLSRLLSSEEDVLDPSVRRDAENLLRAVYPEGKDAADLTQGWMELGEVVCIPNGAPLCAACPLNRLCEARKEGKESELPRRSPKKERRIEEKTVLIFSDGERVALGKREDKGLLAGLWELPSLPGRLTAEEVRSKLAGEGILFEEILPAGEATHLFTHVEWRMTGFFVRTSSPPAGCAFPERETLFRDYAVPSAFRRYLQWIRKNL
ncbi:MAG: A/G-specific adenine glycosylase [Clostridia bacterium]|nr:A/G-specific adenine glycosylase [Clostridia bacterium]